MNFAPPIAAGTLAGIAAGLGALVVVAYILKLRRRRFEVPFSKLWQRVLRERETTSLWRRLRRLLSLAIQLLFLALVLGAALDPKVGEAQASGRHVVLLIDASASMKALDEGPARPPRIERAREAAREVVRGLGGADAAMVIQMDGQATALTRFEPDVPRLLQAIGRVEATDTAADLRRALSAAADALRGRKSPLIVIIGDGAYAEEARAGVLWEGEPTDPWQVDLRGIDVRFVPVGKEGRNVGITAFNVRRYLANKLSYEVLVEVQNFGAAPEQLKLTLLAGTDPVDVRTIALAAGERRREIYPDLGGGADRALRATIEPAAGADVFALDDTAFALLPEVRKQHVLLVSSGNLYLEGALLLDANITVDKLTPEEYAAGEASLPAYDVVVYDGTAPVAAPPAPAVLVFGPPAGKSPVAVRGTATRPIITDLAPDHPVTRWVTMGDVNIDRSLVFAPADGDVVLARSVRDPIVVAGRREGRKVVAFGFDLASTDLGLRVGFPVLVVNALGWFAGDDTELLTTFRTGHTWSVPVDSETPVAAVTVEGPAGRFDAPVTDGRARIHGRHVGFYRVKASGLEAGSIGLAANLADPFESSLEPEAKLALGGRELGRPPTFAPSMTRSIWMWLALGAFLLSTIEWATWHRRVTV